MGFFDFFKKKGRDKSHPKAEALKETVLGEEKNFYQADSYYTDVVAEGTAFEHRVISFEDRKKTAIPSARGLYPAEILLLEYCSKGTYPRPKNGYPGFWWFAYGIRDVGAVLKNLEERGYIVLTSPKDSLRAFTVQELKGLLIAKGQPTTGKKAELIVRVAGVVSEEELLEAGVQRKYALTDIGQQELTDNAYVPYMHSVHNKTIEDAGSGMTFNVWSINKLLGSGDKSNWKAVVEDQAYKLNKEMNDRYEGFMNDLKKTDNATYRVLKKQDRQLAAIQKAREKYDEDKNLDAYIDFWEMVWKNGGLKFEGSKWHFELPDLYIKAKRYDEALTFVMKLKDSKLSYADKAEDYIKKIEEHKLKYLDKKKN